MAKTFDFEMYRYTPSLTGAIVGIIVFSILAGLQFWQWLRCRKTIVIWLFVGAICEIAGYGARIGSHYDTKGWAPFIIQGVLLLVGPLFFAATIYMFLARTIRVAGGEEVSIVKPKWCTRIFVGADISTLVVQGLGASIMGTMKLALAIAGEKIVIAGLALQVATFVFFVITSADFHIRMNRKSRQMNAVDGSDDWRKMLRILYITSSLILFRCIFRLIEYAMGNASYLMSHEWTLYTFDTVPMALVLVLMLVLNPAKYVPQDITKQRSPSSSDEEQLGTVRDQYLGERK
ncbi:RTA1-domain-containing protein [Aaosphaeria arxii CBS 175.79]|uniref:RTA1-domain-containing protein n=1 Tax=Aaosphaeria arxii CBS 175.79 TaxID=1450172 RepID=A0A6A5XEH4_9PLEO|nr:RTA1-domain-containing protein [Aaosphaeria arxii CBS 175.79]KAF2011303.1 RTA1-domain-containing protein [Aaosphaeria arxii CBS 175.79]